MYRIFSPTAILGYGFPKSSFDNAMDLKLDLIAVDAGSVDAGPYYLGSGNPYSGDMAVQRDLELLIRGALKQGCPLVIGSAGFAGSKPGLNNMYRSVKVILEKEASKGVKVARINSDVDPASLVNRHERLNPVGHMPPLSESMIMKSAIVGQMGVEPIIAALDSGASVIVGGRAYDPAIFSADPIRRGYPVGMAFHAAKILECGAIACEPGDGSDGMIAELHKDGKAVFYPVSKNKKATIRSIAAHTLYEKSRPDFFFLPGGILSIQNTEFFQVDERTAGLRGSEFKSAPYSIKLEGSRYLGNRVVSIIPVTNSLEPGNSILIYGRNGVENDSPAGFVSETGVIVMVKSKDRTVSLNALSFIRSTMLHCGYPGRISTAGNLAFPFSPTDMIFSDEEDNYTALFIAGTRDPVFQKQWRHIRDYVLSAFFERYPALFRQSEVTFLTCDKEHPVAVIETVESELKAVQKEHKNKIRSIAAKMDKTRQGFMNIDMGATYNWSIHHTTTDMDFITGLFPVEMEEYDGLEWKSSPSKNPDYGILETMADKGVLIDENKYLLPEQKIDTSRKEKWARLQEVAEVIRSKNAGINQITFDIFFKSIKTYDLAVRSGIFSKENIAEHMSIQQDAILGCYRFEPALAIKFTLHRKDPAGSPGDRDVFGAQQHTRLLDLKVPRHS
jgi:hypothetical protein